MELRSQALLIFNFIGLVDEFQVSINLMHSWIPGELATSPIWKFELCGNWRKEATKHYMYATYGNGGKKSRFMYIDGPHNGPHTFQMSPYELFLSFQGPKNTLTFCSSRKKMKKTLSSKFYLWCIICKSLIYF